MTSDTGQAEAHVFTAQTDELLAHVTPALLSRCGANEGRPPTTLRIESFQQALEKQRSFDWDNTKLDGKAELSVRLHNEHVQRFQRWNEIVKVLRPRVNAAIEARCHEVIATSDLSGPEQKRLVAGVRWDILHACMEYEYADLVPPPFYDRLAKIYLAGFLPCGWQGQYPAGTLEVY